MVLKLNMKAYSNEEKLNLEPRFYRISSINTITGNADLVPPSVYKL